MDKSTFLQLQYNALREEIAETKTRKFKLLMYGAAIFPALYGASWKIDDLKSFMFAIPILVIVCTMIYIKQLNTIYRCGNYIMCHIERVIIENEDPDFVGWEKYLEDTGPFGRQSVDRLTQYCILILFIIYYIFSTIAAVIVANNFFRSLKVNTGTISNPINIAGAVALIFYIVIFIIFVIYSYHVIRISNERRKKVCKEIENKARQINGEEDMCKTD